MIHVQLSLILNQDMSLLTPPSSLPALVRALRHVLRPLIRLMLANGVTYPLVSELIKGVYVEVADQDFRLDNRSPSNSRISLISGVHRKDVRRLREVVQLPEEVVPHTVSFGGQMVATWLGDARFLDEEGQARPLARTRAGDGKASFEDLVTSRSTDIRPRVVLDEWLRIGIVRMDEMDRLVLNTEAFVPQTGQDEKLYFFAHNLHDHAATATDNLLGNRTPQFERSVLYEGLSEESVDLLDKRARQLGSKMLKEINRLAMERESADKASAAARHRFTCGVYFYSEPVELTHGDLQTA